MTTKNPDFPSMRWHPETGEMQVFNALHEVPEGWLDAHPNSASVKKPAKVDPDKLPMTKDEIVAALTAGNIPFKATQGAKALYDVLDKALREHLTANETVIPENSNVPALLALVKASE